MYSVESTSYATVFSMLGKNSDLSVVGRFCSVRDNERFRERRFFLYA